MEAEGGCLPEKGRAGESEEGRKRRDETREGPESNFINFKLGAQDALADYLPARCCCRAPLSLSVLPLWLSVRKTMVMTVY